MKKDAKLNAWLWIIEQKKVPPPFKKWTEANEWKLEKAQLDTVEMEHTHLGHLEGPKKKELILSVRVMSEDEFARLAKAVRNSF